MDVDAARVAYLLFPVEDSDDDEDEDTHPDESDGREQDDVAGGEVQLGTPAVRAPERVGGVTLVYWEHI